MKGGRDARPTEFSMPGVLYAGGVRFVSASVARAEAERDHRRPDGGRPPQDARPTNHFDELLDWRGVAECVYGPEEGARKTWDAVRHLWNTGISDGAGGRVKLASVETPRGRRSSVQQCREFMEQVDERRKAARCGGGSGATRQVHGRTTPARGQIDAGLSPVPQR